MVSVVKNKRSLKKRINRFFSTDSADRAELSDFLHRLGEVSDIYIFGGVVRDIALNGIEGFRSDIDVVFVENEKLVQDFLSIHNPEKNKFGGARITLGKWPIDIWHARDSWAFREGHKVYTGIDSLLETTITNWDSAIFDWNRNRLIYRDSYLTDLIDGYIDMELKENPNEIGMIVRLLRLYTSNDVKNISPCTAMVLAGGISKYTLESIQAYERGSFDTTVISEKIYESIKSNKLVKEPGLLPIEIEHQEQKNLF